MTIKNKEISEDGLEDMHEEDTQASASLKAGSRSIADPKAIDGSKVAMMKTMMSMASGMGKEDMTDWFNKAIALIGHEADKVSDNSGKNQSSVDSTLGSGPKTKDAMSKLASITPGQTMREDVADLFGNEDLSEEFKEKATAIFEAAVVSQLLVAREELVEEFQTALNEEIARIESESVENLDKYLDYVVEEWMKENEVAIESSLRTELTNDFMEGLKNLFAEHYIDLPEDKVDVVESLSDKVAELEDKLNATITENLSLKDELVNTELSSVVEELASDLVMTQQEKFKSLAEEIEFDGDISNYKKKLKIVKETYFNNESPTTSNIEEEIFETNDSQPVSNALVNRYVQAISRTAKK
jgi:hypothetical protein